MNQNTRATIDRLELDNLALREYYERNLTSRWRCTFRKREPLPLPLPVPRNYPCKSGMDGSQLRDFMKAHEENREAARIAALKKKEEEEEAAAISKAEQELKMALASLSDIPKFPRKQPGAREAQQVKDEATSLIILAAEKLANVTPTIRPAADVMAASSPPKEKVVRFADIEDEIQVVPRDPEPEPPAPLVPVLRAGRRTVSEATLNEESSAPSKKRKGLKAFFRRLTPSGLRPRTTAVAAC